MDSTPFAWNTSRRPLHLNAGQVHLWRLNLRLPNDLLLTLEETLSEDEIQRANRFHFRHDRDHFIASHGCLREILAYYIRRGPKELHFHKNLFGKPALDGKFSDHQLNFNLSHSHELGLLALGLNRRLGVDIEYIRHELNEIQIAQRFFSTYELNSLLALPDHLKREAFFNCWTRKEAYIKARGEGLSAPLDEFSVTLTPGEPAMILNTLPDSQESSWSLFHINPKPGYIAALAVEGNITSLRYFDYH